MPVFGGLPVNAGFFILHPTVERGAEAVYRQTIVAGLEMSFSAPFWV
jgi:hypothetical protein